jgi:hypothetical protein
MIGTRDHSRKPTLHLLRSLSLASLALLSSPAISRDLTDEERATAMDFAMHDAIFTLYHESGHLLVGELGIPVLGKEEDAADSIAVILILNYTDDRDERYNTLIDVADGWYMNAQNSTGQGIDDLSFYDEHSLDIQRAYSVVCMMVGADPGEFGEVAEVYDMDADRQEACGPVYQQSEAAWMTLLDSHFTDTPTASIEIVYDEAGDYEDIETALKERQVMESLAELLKASFTLPRPVTLRASQCGDANAYYDPDAHEITYCYELGAEMYALYANSYAEEDEPVDEAGGTVDNRKYSSGSKGG